MTRALFTAAIRARRLVEGEALPIERRVIVPLAILILAAAYGGIFG